MSDTDISQNKEELKKELLEYFEAINSYSGNRKTKWTPFQQLMLEERINILADILVLLLADKLVSMK